MSCLKTITVVIHVRVPPDGTKTVMPSKHSLFRKYSFLFSSFCCFSFRLRNEQEDVPEEDTKKYVKKKKKTQKPELVSLLCIDKSP